MKRKNFLIKNILVLIINLCTLSLEAQENKIKTSQIKQSTSTRSSKRTKPQVLSFSDQAWMEITPIYKKILKHPFNVQMASGTLNQNIFNFYKKQDAYYLKHYSTALASLSKKVEALALRKTLYHYAIESLSEDLSDEEVSTLELSPANLHYTSFLLSTAYVGSKEEILASLLPCFWIYYQLGVDLKQQSVPNNPYESWINLYTSENFKNEVEMMIDLFNSFANQASPELRKKMLENFKVASFFEYKFWDDAFQSTTVKNEISSSLNLTNSSS